MTDRRKLNQPSYTEPVDKTQSNISNKENNPESTGIYQNSESFPPRGSFINIPEDIVQGKKAKFITSIVEDKIKNIGSDLYKETDDNKKK